ncbi:uncharacterized protein LOC128489765 [Spea bombifrons]|uniref:uncharacterized protein LOC128489765 n=1 Tax=Spea bombifrons TaxID=233779 RepID=UPI00234B3DE2|nr:uncharacterized protein LOC128489765 [Spea bombifrons]
MNEGASLSRFKNAYRLRYCPSAGLEEPPELQPGQNVLSAIQNYFDDSESHIEADTLGIGNTSTPVSEISSRFAVSSKRSSVNPTYRASGNFPTPKSLKSGFQDEKVHRPFTPAHKLQTPSSGNWSNIQKKSLPLAQTEHKGSASESDSDESHNDVNCGAILLAPGEDATNRAPDVKGPLDLSTKFYKIDGSVMHDHASPTIRLPTKKRLSFRNATLMKEGGFAQDDALKLMSEGTKNAAAPVEKTCTVDSLHSTIVPNHPASHFIQDEEEEEFMINEEDSCVLDTWLGVRESNPQKGESQSKRVAAKSEIPSQIAHGKKDTTVKGKRKYQVQSSAQNNDKPAKEDIPPAKLKRANKLTNVTPDRHLVLSKDEQFGKAANTLTPESRRKTPKGKQKN